MIDASAVEKLIRVLETNCGFQRVHKSILSGEPFEFDAVLQSPDPLTLVVVQYRSAPPEEDLRQLSRQLASFVWSLFSLGKRHMASVVLLTDNPLSAKQCFEMKADLNGVCRLILLDTQMSGEETKSRLLPMGKPTFTRMKLTGIQTSKTIERLIETAPDHMKPHLQGILEISGKSRNAEEVTDRISDEYQRLINEALDALKKSDS